MSHSPKKSKRMSNEYKNACLVKQIHQVQKGKDPHMIFGTIFPLWSYVIACTQMAWVIFPKNRRWCCKLPWYGFYSVWATWSARLRRRFTASVQPRWWLLVTICKSASPDLFTDSQFVYKERGHLLGAEGKGQMSVFTYHWSGGKTIGSVKQDV